MSNNRSITLGDFSNQKLTLLIIGITVLHTILCNVLLDRHRIFRQTQLKPNKQRTQSNKRQVQDRDVDFKWVELIPIYLHLQMVFPYITLFAQAAVIPV